MQINTNMAAINAWRSLEHNQANLQSSLQRLSSGQRINSAADDAAGLAVSEKMTAQTRGLTMATRNTQDAVSLVQTADGGANSIQDMLQRMRELSVQAGSDTLSNDDRSQLQQEFSSLQSEIDRTAKSVSFNGQNLLDGSSNQASSSASGITNLTASGLGSSASASLSVSYDGTTLTVKDAGNVDVSGQFSVDASGNVTAKTGTGNNYGGLSFSVASGTTNAAVTLTKTNGLAFQVGANNGDTITTNLGNLKGSNLGISSLDISTKSGATTAISTLDKSLSFVSTERAKMGAMQNRLENTISTLQTQNENLTAANSRIKDVDMAAEMANFTKYQVLSQASTAMLAQANQLPQGILSLLR